MDIKTIIEILDKPFYQTVLKEADGQLDGNLVRDITDFYAANNDFLVTKYAGNIIYFPVDDINQTLAKISSSGGKVTMLKMPMALRGIKFSVAQFMDADNTVRGLFSRDYIQQPAPRPVITWNLPGMLELLKPQEPAFFEPVLANQRRPDRVFEQSHRM